MFKQILIPLDGSRLAEHALAKALAISDKFGAELTLLRVVERPNVLLYSEGWIDVAIITEMEEQARLAAIEYLRQKEADLAVCGQTVSTRIVERLLPADAILETAAEIGADLIVMSTHGHGGLTRWVLGSVADKVMQKAQIPLLLIRVADEMMAVELPPIKSEADLHQMPQTNMGSAVA